MFGYLLASVSVIAIGGTAAATPFIINGLANGDSFFTKVREGTAKAVMRGGSKGSFDHFVMSFKGHHLNDPRNRKHFIEGVPAWELIKHGPTEEEDRTYDFRDPLTRWLGVYYVGIPPFRDILTYHFTWSETRKDEKTNKDGVWFRDANTDFIYVADFPYVVICDSAETNEGIPVDATYQLVVRVTNPFKALFETENWLESVTSAANRAARNYIGDKTFKALQSEVDEGVTEDGVKVPCKWDSFSEPIVKLTDRVQEDSDDAGFYERGLRGRYGVTVVAAQLQTIAINTGDPKLDAKVFESTILSFTSKQDAERVVVLGEAEATKIRAVGNATAESDLAVGTAAATVISLKGKAEAESIVARLQAWDSGSPELSRLIAQLDAMASDGPGKTVIWANNPFVNQHPGLAQALEALGVKDVEGLKAILEQKKGDAT